MKRLILFAFLFSALAVPALGELTDADLDKIRLIVKAEIAPVKSELEGDIASLKSELKGDIASLKSELKGDIASLKSELKEDIAESEKNLRTHIDTKFEGVHKQITLLTNFVYALIALIVAAIAIPQLILTWRSSGDRQQQRINQELREEIEALKQQQIARP